MQAYTTRPAVTKLAATRPYCFCYNNFTSVATRGPANAYRPTFLSFYVSVILLIRYSTFMFFYVYVILRFCYSTFMFFYVCYSTFILFYVSVILSFCR